MNSLKKYERSVTAKVPFKKKLILLIKQNPVIWNGCDSENQDVWKKIEKEMEFVCSLEELQKTWNTLYELYFRKIFIRTIERNFEAPNWEYFHDLSFLYETVKENIQQKLGGISPPMFKKKPNEDNSHSITCPCCIDVDCVEIVDTEIETLPQIKQEDEDNSNFTSTTDPPFDDWEEVFNNTNSSSENNTQIPESVKEKDYGVIDLNDDSESTSSKSSYLTDSSLNLVANENPFFLATDFPELQRENESENSLLQTNVHDSMNNTSLGVIDLSDDFEIDKVSSLSTIQEASQTDNANQTYPAISLAPQLGSENNLKRRSYADVLKGNNSEVINIDDDVEMTATPSNSQILPGKHESTEKKIKLRFRLRNSDRMQIIAAVKANPEVYLNVKKKKKSHELDAWKRVADAAKLPIYSAKARWKLIKDRYLKELVRERYYNGSFKSVWEHYQDMEFMRPFMQNDIEEIHATRMRLQKNNKNSSSNTTSIENSTIDKQTPLFDRTAAGRFYKRHPPTKAPSTKQPLVLNQTTARIPLNTNSLSPIYRKVAESIDLTRLATENVPKANTESQCLESSVPKITVSETSGNDSNENGMPQIVILPPGYFFINKDKIDELNAQNAGNPPPAKKLILDSELKTDNNMTLNGAPMSLPDLTANIPARIVQLVPQSAQNLVPPVAGIANGALSVVAKDSKTIKAAQNRNNFQQAFINELFNSKRVKLNLDLLQNNVKDQNNKKDDENAGMNPKATTKKDDNDVICIDDDSAEEDEYEEVYVYVNKTDQETIIGK